MHFVSFLADDYLLHTECFVSLMIHIWCVKEIIIADADCVIMIDVVLLIMNCIDCC